MNYRKSINDIKPYTPGLSEEKIKSEYQLNKVIKLASNENTLFTREQLLDEVWGYEYIGSSRTVDVHIRRLREKIEPNPSEPIYIFTRWGAGYYFKK